MDMETVITHLQIIHTWAEFARELDLQFFTAKHLEDIAQWTADALALLKEQEKFEPYAIEPKFKKIKVPEKCSECKSCNAMITGSSYCHMAAISPENPQMDISTIYVDVDSRPVWCPIVKVNNELDTMPFDKKVEFEKLITGLSSLFGGEDLWE